MKTISVLGSGWLGLPLVHHFIEAGYGVKTSTTSSHRIEALRSAGAEPYIIDIGALSKEVDPFLQADILIVNIPAKNVSGFRHLVAAIEHSKVEHVILVSSTSVYQNINKTITESDLDCYSSSPLLEIEDLFKSWGAERTTIIRFGGLIGYRRHPGRFFKSGRVVQNPESPVNLIHRDDCVEIIRHIVEKGIWGEVLNGCSDTHPTKREFYTWATALLGAEPPEFGQSDPGAGKLINNRKLKQRLNYQFKYPDLMKIQFEESA